MLRKEILIICLIICCLFSLQAVAAASDGNSTDQVVLTTDGNVSAYSLPNTDDQLRDGSDAGTFSDLQNDLSLGGDIVLTKNYTFDSDKDTGLVNGISVPDTVNSITGIGNIVIDGSRQARIFNIHSSHSIILTGITFINANADGNGGSINSDGTLIISDCNFINNTASCHGGAVYLGSGEGDTITNCNFEGNIAGGNGGAIDWYAGSSKGQIAGSTFTDNTAKRSGGAVHWSGHYGTIRDSNFTNNIATGEVTGEIGGIVGGGDGGAVLWVGSNGTVDNCIFTNNVAQNRGGAIFLHGNSTENCTNTTLSHSIFINNNAGLNGGAVDWQEGAHDGVVTYCDFTNNTASSTGGAVYWSGHNGTILHSNFTNNKALGTVNGTGPDGSIIPGGNGGAIVWKGAEGDIINTTFRLNNASRNGGAIFMQAGSNEDCSNITVDGGLFIENYAGVNGGALDWYEGAHDADLYNSVFINNTAERSGGAVYWFGHDGTIANSTFENNRALGNVNATDSYGRITPGGHGGAIMWTGANGTVLNSTFRLNNASRNGGAIYMQGSTEGDCSNITVDDCDFIENYAGINGGALDWYEGAHDSTLSNSYFFNNTAERSGGAVYWFGHDGTIANSTFENNRALGNVNATDSYGRITPGGHGGAIMWTGANGTVLNSTFRLNNASRNGGAIYMQGSTEGDCDNILVDGSEFVENYAGINGGAVDWYEGSHDSTLSNSYFFNNTAKRSGGAVYWYGHRGTIRNSTFTDNQALGLVNASSPYGYNTTGGDGGAVIWTGSDGLMDNCTFTNNHAAKRGGAMYLQGGEFENCTNVTINNGIFKDNRAETNGGAIDFHEGATDGYIIGSTFDNNTAVTGFGGALVWRGHNGEVEGSSFTNNYARGDGGAAYIEGESCSLYNSTFNNNIAGDDGGAVYWTGDHGEIFNVTANNNKGISEGASHSKGGTIIITGSHMTVDTLVVSNSFAEEEAGGLFLTGNYVNVTNAKFTKCYASMDRTAQNITRGGGAVIIGNNTRLINVTIEDSQAERGGAIYWQGNDGYAYNVTATRNFAPEEGGALYIAGEDCQIYESEFTDNIAGDDGGAIYWEGDNGHIEECNFENNTGLSMWNQYDGKSHTSKGGTVSIIGDNLKLLNSNFTGSSTHNNGNNNNFGGTLFITGEDVKIDGCDFNDSSSQGSDGGTIYIIGNRTEISDSTFSNSTARSGGAIYVDGTYTVIKGSEFDTCTANSPGAQGGAIYIHGQQTVVEESNFVNSSAAFRGGAIYIDGLNAIIRNSNFTDSSVSGEKYYNQNPRGGAVYIKENYATIEGSIFNHSTVSSDVGEGGAIFVQGNYANVSGSEFESSSAKTGGAVYLEGNSATVSDSTFTSSHANENGGAMYSTGSNSLVLNSNFNDNLAELSGGAIYWYGGANSRYNTVNGCTFTNNIAHGNTTGTITRGGGAIYWSEGGYYGTIKDSKFYNNSVQSTISKKVDGGAVLWDKSYHALVDNCIFVGNFVTTDGDTSGTSASDVWAQGGAMYLRPNANYTIRNCLFENCSSSKEAGALYIQGLASSSARMITLEDSVFINNVAQANGKYNINGGGAIQIKECPHAVFNNITFINNTANKGGGLCVYNSVSDLVVTGVNFTGNKANRGSAISASVFFTLNDAVLLDNRADTTKFDLDFNQNSGSVDIVLEGADTHLNSMYIKHGNKGFTISCNNVTYWTDNNITTGQTAVQTGTISSIKDGFAREAGIPVLVEIFDGDNNKLYEGVYATDADGKIHLEVANVLTEPYQLDDIYVNARLLNEDYYTRAADTSRDKDVFIDASALDTIFHRNTTVTANITGKTGSILQSARGIISVYIDDVFKGNMTIENGKGSLENILTNFTADKFFEVGNHTVFLKYWGDAKYNEVNTTVSFNITKAQSNLTVNMDDMGYNLYMNFTIFDDWDGKAYEDANGIATVNFYSEEDPSTVVRFVDVKIVDGFGSVVIRDLLPRNYTIRTIYHDDNNYNGSSYEANYTLHQKEFAAVFIEVNAYDIMVNDTVYINVTIVPPEGYDVPGNVTLYLDNIGYNLTLTMGATNATATFNATNLTAGIKKVIVFYEGSKLLGPAKGEADFRVLKYDTPLSADVTNITVIQNEIINITLSNDTTGVVSVIVDGKEYFGRVKNGTVSIELPKLPVGKYNVTLYYEGDNKYNNATNYTVFYVVPMAPEIIIDVDNVTYGNETLIVVTLPEDATGNVTVKINDTYYVFDTQNLTDGKAILPGVVLSAGNYTVEVTYNGDENYAANTNSANFTVFKATPMLNITAEDIYYGEEANITVTVPDGVTGNITIKINGTDKNITLPIVDGKVNWTVGGLAVGNYVVIATYSGNANYTDAVVTDDFNVLQIGTVLDVDVHNIPVWDTEYVNVTIKDAAGNIITNATGNVTMNIDGVDYTAEIKDGVARFNISSLTVGHKVAWVFYDGDRNITGNRSKAEFDVTQRVPEVNVTALNITVDQEGKITINIPANATGFVILSGNFTKSPIYVDKFTNGVAEITVNDLAVGNYSVHIKYYGGTLDNYTVAENDTTFRVDSINTTISIDVESIDYGNKANITVTVNNNATGYITIRINETRTITLPIVDGKVNWIVEDLAAGNYTVYANYSGDGKYNVNETNKTFEVRQISPNVEIIHVDSISGENATIIVRADPRVTENVTIEVRGKQYSMAVDEDGVALFTTDVLENGTYTIVASYPGDRNFTVNSTEYTFTTNRTSDYVMNITASDIYVGNNTNITVYVPVDATGNVIIELNGTNYTVAISQGKAVLNNVSTLKEGVYIVTAYFGNDKYVNKTASTRFTVSKVGSPIKVDVENILYVDDTAYINVTVPDDNAGNVTIEINGKVYGPESVTDGVARFVVPNVTYGNKTVAITYSGTDKYVSNFTTANFAVSKRTPIVNVTNITIIVGNDAVINISGPSDRNGTLIVSVDGANYAVKMTGGNATLTVNGLSVGNYTVSVTYVENDKYVEGTASGWVNVTAKGTSAINITVEDVYYVGEEIVIALTPVNSTGNISVTINGEKYNITNNKVTIENGLPMGTYEIVAVLDEDEYYYGSTANATFQVVKKNMTISVNTTTVPATIYVGSPVTITANLNESVTGDVVFTINGANYTVHVADSNVATIAYTPVNNDTITVVATFMGNDKYKGNVSDPQKFNVNRVPTDISVTVKTPITYGDVAVITVELNETINATVKLTVDGKEYDVAIINGKGGLNVSGLNSGDHKVNVTYAGDDKYVGSENSTSFTVDNATLVADVTALNVTVEQNTTFVINVTDDFNGNVSIKVGDKVLYNGSAKTLILADVLPAGDKTATVVFYGDSNYDELTLNDVKFTVSRVDPSIDVVIDDVTYPDKAVAFIYVGNDANGTVNITVDGKVFSGTVSKGVAQVDLTGLSAGSKVASVEFFATDDYNDNATASAKFTVLKANTTLDVEFKPIIYVNETQVINITVNNTNATGNVTIMIGGKNYTAPLINGRANFTTDLLPYGNHTLTVIYEGDKNLTGSLISKTIEVIKLPSDLTISVTNITTASDETIKVNVTTGATGSVVITVDGKDYYVDLDNGVATLALSNLANKTYTVHAKYLGDDNYTTCEGDASFNVAKVNSTVSVKVENITVGDVAVVNITVPADATGNVTVEIDGVGTYTVPVAGGTGLWVVKDLEVGTYTVKVTYNGDDNYLPSNNETTFKVSKAESGDIKVVDQGNRTVVITVPGKDGNVTVKVGNNTYNATVVDGVATVDLVNETPGPKDITVFYSGDENNPNATANATVNIPKYDTPMSIEVANSTVGNVTTVIVNVPKDVKGNVTVAIDGKTYSVKPVDGKAVFEIEGLIAGNKTVAASYAGDDWFVANSTVAHFKVDKVASSVNVTGDVINVGENATITITGPKDYNGTAVVNVDGKNYTVSISNGAGQLEITGLANGTYDVKVTLLETDKYLGSENDTAKVLVNKVESFVTVNVDDITVGDVAVVNITVPADATGNVTVEIVGVGTYTVPVAGGAGVLVVKDLKVDNYTVKVTYNGDGKYLPNNNETTFKVSKADSDDIKVIDQGNGTVVITVPGEDGNVTVKVGNETYNVTVVNGTAVVTLNNVTPGEHEIEVIYSGDENHNGTSTNSTVSIPKYDTPMSIEVANSTVGNVTTVTVNVPKDVKDNVTVAIDGKTYSVKPVDGKAVFEIEGLIAGNKTVAASYAGDDWFVANSTVAHFKVDKVASSVNVTGDVINVGENATITITGPKDYNGTAVVNVDGKNYTVSISNGAGQLEITG
ncbi:Ig-like domain-containing protein, partial [Methanobrevibacter thaueri]|uniref:Ig-like domain-containing protein n=1 Tax=Methanobrevibacter thaueri TaxID=190975 RepID=UPI0010583162